MYRSAKLGTVNTLMNNSIKVVVSYCDNMQFQEWCTIFL